MEITYNCPKRPNNYYSPDVSGSLGCSRINIEEMRIMMVGKTGTGKSFSGNTILGRQHFESKFSPRSVTADCSKGKAEVNGQQVAVIDTPGLFDTRFGMSTTPKVMSQCITYAAPGPHVFLVVIRLGRYTEEEMHTVQRIQEIFGQAADRYSMVLFTHGHLLKGTTIEDFLDESSELQELVARCNGQYHVFNDNPQDRSQVTQLLEKIRNLVQKNKGSHYTNDMFQEAQRAIEEEKRRKLREEAEKIRKEKEEQERKMKEQQDEMLRKVNEQYQVQREMDRKEREEEKRREREIMAIERENERKRNAEKREAERRRDEERRQRDQAALINLINEQHRREIQNMRDMQRRDDCSIL